MEFVAAQQWRRTAVDAFAARRSRRPHHHSSSKLNVKSFVSVKTFCPSYSMTFSICQHFPYGTLGRARARTHTHTHRWGNRADAFHSHDMMKWKASGANAIALNRFQVDFNYSTFAKCLCDSHSEAIFIVHSSLFGCIVAMPAVESEARQWQAADEWKEIPSSDGGAKIVDVRLVLVCASIERDIHCPERTRTNERRICRTMWHLPYVILGNIFIERWLSCMISKSFVLCKVFVPNIIINSME